jgi:SAM-dependent methyltransferase
LKREFTNLIRFAMDELLPPIIRDSRWFMAPFYMLAYGTHRVARIMNFKSAVYDMTDEEYARFYAELGKSISRRRVTDLNAASLDWLLQQIPAGEKSLIDVGCGNGFLLRYVAKHRPNVTLAGVDVVARPDLPVGARYETALLPSLPFEDEQFDITLCTHVLEHVIDLPAAAQELLRITRERIVIVVPRQRYYYFTLDEHVNFFWQYESLARHFKGHAVEAKLVDGDWALAIMKKASVPR